MIYAQEMEILKGESQQNLMDKKNIKLLKSLSGEIYGHLSREFQTNLEKKVQEAQGYGDY